MEQLTDWTGPSLVGGTIIVPPTKDGPVQSVSCSMHRSSRKGSKKWCYVYRILTVISVVNLGVDKCGVSVTRAAGWLHWLWCPAVAAGGGTRRATTCPSPTDDRVTGCRRRGGEASIASYDHFRQHFNSIAIHRQRRARFSRPCIRKSFS